MIRRNVLSVFIQAGFATALGTSSALAVTVTSTADSGPGSLRAAVAEAATGDTIDFDCAALACPATLTLSSQGNDQGFPGPTALVVSGKAISIAATNPGDITLQAQPGATSATSLRLFFVDTGAALTLRNVSLTGGRAIGGNGGAAFQGSGGAAAGLGGAIFNQGDLVLDTVALHDNAAMGGTGLSIPTFGQNFAGGGGLGGDGGAAPSGGGGGTGGAGGTAYMLPDGTRFAGKGGPGLGGLGGGSPGGYNSHSGLVGPGAPSNGGGSGGGYFTSALNASDGGGGGSSGSGGPSAGTPGAGGFGGGGGGNYGLPSMGCRAGGGGAGGFGGGGAASPCGGGPGGVGGGKGGNYNNQGSPGGGGAGFGGAVFSRSGTVTVQSSAAVRLEGNDAVGGSGAHDGASSGGGLFFMSGVTTAFDIAGSLTVTDTLADDSAISLPSGQSYTAGNGVGAALTKNGSGELILDANVAIAGATTVNAGVLGGIASISGPLVLKGGATIAPGDPAISQGVGVLSAASLAWDGGGAIAIQLGANQSHSDQLALSGSLAKTGSGTYMFHFGTGQSAPVVGTTYTLIHGSDTGTFAVGDFAYDFDSSFGNLAGHFGMSGGDVTFTVDAVSTDVIFSDGFE